jgi:hypothetical protein
VKVYEKHHVSAKLCRVSNNFKGSITTAVNKVILVPLLNSYYARKEVNEVR